MAYGTTPTPGYTLSDKMNAGSHVSHSDYGIDRSDAAIQGGLSGAAAGAAIGASIGLIGGPLGSGAGALIGAGVGFIGGSLFGDSQAIKQREAAREAALERQKAIDEQSLKEVAAHLSAANEVQNRQNNQTVSESNRESTPSKNALQESGMMQNLKSETNSLTSSGTF